MKFDIVLNAGVATGETACAVRGCQRGGLAAGGREALRIPRALQEIRYAPGRPRGIIQSLWVTGDGRSLTMMGR